MALDHVQIVNEQTGKKIFAMFNPEEYSLNKDNNYASQAIPGLTSPLLQFVHGNLQTLDMELFFDTFDTQDDVRTRTSQVFDLLAIDSDLHTPPVLRVTWGSLDFRCVLAKVSQKFIRFYSDGRPGRAHEHVLSGARREVDQHHPLGTVRRPGCPDVYRSGSRAGDLQQRRVRRRGPREREQAVVLGHDGAHPPEPGALEAEQLIRSALPRMNVGAIRPDTRELEQRIESP